VKEGVLLRPLGNVVYLLPPYCITPEEIGRVYEVIERFLEAG
jgi:adenosylmethionine-8-amino-7-oxononanoate aminotransferase